MATETAEDRGGSPPPSLAEEVGFGGDKDAESAGGGRKTTCTVCGEVSNNHHTHYGALVCYSCRAFFRRANQSNLKNNAYICKYEARCEINATNRKKCQKCR